VIAWQLKLPIAALALVLGSASAFAGGGEAPEELPRSKRATGEDAAELAPIGLTDARALAENQWALSYRYSWIHGDDMRDGVHRESTDDVLQQFGETPRKRDVQLHLFGVSYAPHSRVTLSVKLPFITQKTHVVAAGTPQDRFTTTSSGLGDLELRALVPFMRKRNQSLQLEMGITAPTGSISERDEGAGGMRERLTIPQQPGSGTVDLLPGLVYRGRWKTLSWGFVGRGKFRVYKNSKSYRLGNEYLLSTWLSQSWTDWMSTSLRLSWNRHNSGHPKDDTTRNPEADPKRLAGEFLDIGPGVNFRVPFLGEPRFGVEMTWPFYQTVQGPQLERDWQLTAGWQWAF
jgi:hypothetical protein